MGTAHGWRKEKQFLLKKGSSVAVFSDTTEFDLFLTLIWTGIIFSLVGCMNDKHFEGVKKVEACSKCPEKWLKKLLSQKKKNYVPNFLW